MSTENPSDARVKALQQEVMAQEGKIPGAATAGDVQSIIAELDSIQSRMPLGVNSGDLQSRITSVRKAAEDKLKQEQQEQEAELVRMFSHVVSAAAFCHACYGQMQHAEKKFYDSFAAGRSYETATWQDGRYVASEEKLDGTTLKEDFARIKYHALNENDQKKVGKPPGGGSEMDEMDRLDKSLDHMEGYQGEQLRKKGASKEECERCHGNFKKAHDQVARVKARHQKVHDLRKAGKDRDAEMENALLNDEKKKLGKTLQEDVINDTLVPEQSKGKQLTQGMDVSAPSGPPLAMRADTVKPRDKSNEQAIS